MVAVATPVAFPLQSAFVLEKILVKANGSEIMAESVTVHPNASVIFTVKVPAQRFMASAVDWPSDHK